MGNDNQYYGIQLDFALQHPACTGGQYAAGNPRSLHLQRNGDDYIEGGGGNDLIVGGPGQDDLIGGSSDLFGLAASSDRPDGQDEIHGGDGSGTARNDLGDLSSNGHANDADVIVGDNANIYQLVNGVATAFVSYTHDSSQSIIPRSVTYLDYTPGTNGGTDLGGADTLHGQEGDWNQDGVFDSQDLIGALVAGTYDDSPNAARNATARNSAAS